MDMYEQRMSSFRSTIRKENAARKGSRDSSSSEVSKAKTKPTIMQNEDMSLEETLRLKSQKEIARKRAEVSFLRLRDNTPWKCEGQSVLGKKD